MIASRIKPGDTVQCNVRGRIFRAIIQEKIGRGLWRVEPCHSNITYYRVTSQQITIPRRHDR